ncbi:MAG: exodeoxyribonuclease VII large subunit [Elusimicrobia bacterium]|nr:exodeoxyribonuclease VII large subunit [Elusimicrobiota bacterium]
MEDGHKIYTVSELNNEIKIVFEDVYPDIWVEGEISNFKTYSSGHMYFSLKDEESQISAVIFRGTSRSFRFTPEDGIKVIARGRVSAYPKRGEYQFVINYLEPAGKGALQLAFEQLKKKLEKEGLFDPERKKPIPLLPQKIGIVTSPTGAAIKDILSVINRRYANVEILLYPVHVQGDEAKYDISEAIKYLNDNYPSLDVLLVGRGGGSIEDLWAFNEEMVARAIASSKIPVSSCVGHEIDYTIADFVADMRAATPSSAAELVVKNKAELIEKLDDLKHHIVNQMEFMLSEKEERLKDISDSKAIQNPAALFEDKIHEIDDIQEKILHFSQMFMDAKQKEWGLLREKLGLLSPLNILDRGYSVCFSVPQNKIVKDAKILSVNDTVKVKLSKGEIFANVEKIN